jgi:bifunctional N-acetylglucosamine-1-phosphate-uridyltransferase/glucosamine-1-phosphate-acetyltransferase GlmU-like protein
MTKPLAVVIMAAGKGTRMKNPDMAKVMYQIGGRPMIEYVVDLALRLESQNTVVIVGWQKQMVRWWSTIFPQQARGWSASNSHRSLGPVMP